MPEELSGVIVVDKPAGLTSHDVVARVRRAIHARRVGHTGTLDPLATGVLPLVVGRATRLARFLAAGEKVYDAELRLGVATDTYDVTGSPVAGATAELPDRHRVESALARFHGTFWQTPPAFSAKKIGGVPAYALARRRVPVAPAPVTVTVFRLELTELNGDRVRLHIVSSAGFYVRSLAHEVGRVLGCGAHLTALRRERSGEFTLADAAPLDEIERDAAAVSRRLRPLGALLPELPALVLTPQGARRAAHGNPVPAEDTVARLQGPGARSSSQPTTEATGFVRLLDAHGALVAIAESDPARTALQPIVVLV